MTFLLVLAMLPFSVTFAQDSNANSAADDAYTPATETPAPPAHYKKSTVPAAAPVPATAPEAPVAPVATDISNTPGKAAAPAHPTNIPVGVKPKPRKTNNTIKRAVD